MSQMLLLQLKPDTLYYSPNELRGGIPLLLPSAQSTPLPLDYGWLSEAPVLVEHKTLDNLAQDLRNGHLVAQMEAAKRETPYLYLIVTGIPIPTDRFHSDTGLLGLSRDGEEEVSGNWTFEQFNFALFAVIHGLQIAGPVYTCCKRNTATVIQALFRETRKLKLGKGRPVLEKWQATKGYDQVESYVRALPNVGWERAKALVEFAPTWAELIKRLTRKDTLAKHVRGFGEVMSERIFNLVKKGER